MTTMKAQARGMGKITSPLVGSKTSDLARLLWQHRGAIDVPGKAAALLAMSVMFAPFRAAEWALSSRAVAGHELSESPFFVVGYPRSGTTHLFRMLARDPQFGFLRWRQSVFPHMCGPMRPLADRLLSGLGPSEQPMDGMPFSPDEADEEEFPVSTTCGISGSLFLYFPRDAARLFNRTVLMDGLSPAELDAWRDALRSVFRKASWLSGGKRLVTKNPWNTSRMPLLLDMWPDAPFLHIVRHPYGVYLSAWHALKVGAPVVQMGHAEEDEIHELFLATYRDVLQRHLKERSALPAGQYTEVRYEDLVADPVGQLRNVYDALGFDGWAQFEPNLRAYLETIADYKPNKFRLDRGLAARIVDAWGFAFEEWGYDPDLLVGDEDE